jgi:hypothetical protein
VLVVNRFVVAGAAEEFTSRAQAALTALAARPGYLRGSLNRAYDDAEHWTLLTEWESVGAYRRALGAFDVKVTATPLLAESLDEPSAFEELGSAQPGGETVLAASDLAAPGGSGAPGRPGGSGERALRSRS